MFRIMLNDLHNISAIDFLNKILSADSKQIQSLRKLLKIGSE